MTIELYVCPYAKLWTWLLRDERGRVVAFGDYHDSERLARRAAKRRLK